MKDSGGKTLFSSRVGSESSVVPDSTMNNVGSERDGWFASCYTSEEGITVWGCQSVTDPVASRHTKYCSKYRWFDGEDEEPLVGF